METKLVVLRVWGNDLPQGGKKTGTSVLPLDLPAEVQQLIAGGWRLVSQSTTWAGLSLFITLHLER